MQVDFRQPARLDDVLEVSVVLVECRRASLVLAQAIRRDGALLLDARVRVAALGAGDFRPRAIPDALYDELKPLETKLRQPDATPPDGA
jgi:acyl-CoA thioester hydrolase